TITQGHASDLPDGSGLYNLGSLTLNGVNFTDNHADGVGGGLHQSGGATPAMTDCTFTGNSAGDGGGLWSAGVMTASNCTFTSNSAGFGGGFVNLGRATMTDCTVSGN